jgi:hypothetical protein
VLANILTPLALTNARPLLLTNLEKIALRPVTGHGWRKYSEDESGDNSSHSYAEAFGNEGLDVEGLGGGKVQGDQEHHTAEHAKKRIRRTGALNQGEKE